MCQSHNFSHVNNSRRILLIATGHDRGAAVFVKRSLKPYTTTTEYFCFSVDFSRLVPSTRMLFVRKLSICERFCVVVQNTTQFTEHYRLENLHTISFSCEGSGCKYYLIPLCHVNLNTTIQYVMLRYEIRWHSIQTYLRLSVKLWIP